MTFPYPCVKCGLCCMMEVCPIARNMGGVTDSPCVMLEFNKDKASCGVVTRHPELAPIFGIGSGCCIKATCWLDGTEYDFAALPEEDKMSIAKARRKSL